MQTKNHPSDFGQIEPDDRITGWYAGSSSSNSQTILESAFADAQIFFSRELTSDEHKKIWASSQNSIDEAEHAVRSAADSYEQKRNSKARLWLTALSARVVVYGNIFDVLVQHHPEYSSLAWGAFKLVFTSVINHEELTGKIAKGLNIIAGLLPQARLSLVLYPTNAMQEAVAHLYAHILRFFQKALKWYKEHALTHIFGAVWKPWQLSFQGCFEAVAAHASQVKELTDMALKAEVRDTHLEVMHIRIELQSALSTVNLLRDQNKDLYKLLEVKFENVQSLINSTTQEIRYDLGSQRRSIMQVQLNQLLSAGFWEGLPTSGQSLEYCYSLRDRNRAYKVPLSSNATSMLQNWADIGQQSLMLVECPSRNGLVNFMIDVVDLVRGSNFPLIQALPYPGYWKAPMTPTDIFRILVLNALEVNPEALLNSNNPITTAHLREASSLSDWMALLARAMHGLSLAFIILDDHLLSHATQHDKITSTDIVEKLRSSLGGPAKILAPSSTVSHDYLEKQRVTNNLLVLPFKRMGSEPGVSRALIRRRRLRR